MHTHTHPKAGEAGLAPASFGGDGGPAELAEALAGVDLGAALSGRGVVHPEFGDMTEDVLEELRELARYDEVVVERRQAELALAAGRTARDLSCGRLVAQLDADVFDYWAHREGPAFWADKRERNRFLQRNPVCAVESRSGRIMVGYQGRPRRGGGADAKRGRWAL